MSDFYHLQLPTEWVPAPDTWSSTVLDDIARCPRRWQFLRSAWGEYRRFPVRPAPAAIEGEIIHEALDRLTRACGRLGNPPLGSEGFSAAVSDCNFFDFFNGAISHWQATFDAHPRPGPRFRLRATAKELSNRAIRLFREQYHPETGDANGTAATPAREAEQATDYRALLKNKRNLSEVRLHHPSLPFMGILDLVRLDNDDISIIDFKTGRPSESHRNQLLRYALLWWRNTGDIPSTIHAQHLEGSASWAIDCDELVKIERRLSEEIAACIEDLSARPARAEPDQHCYHCPVRARCNEGWAHSMKNPVTNETRDMEITVNTAPGNYGFLALGPDGTQISIVYQPGTLYQLPFLKVGNRVRLIGTARSQDMSEHEIKAWTECYVLTRIQ